ncbi:MAG: acetyl-CoA carboxylase biotin carboxylase subunit [Bacteroidia bacterium]|nr:acetyl-CoA carboxylase biotin carboxylase subunit [Bacteroidia bacterium]
MTIKKILIANRGEIALRIMRSAREMGIATVAVYSEADRSSPHVRYADESVCIGPPPSSQSYLDMKKVIEAAWKTKSDAIHPGYGFLSENPVFSKEVKRAGLIFIGPDAAAMEMMGSKLSAKTAAKKFNIPLVPGSDGAINSLSDAIDVAEQIEYPLLIKASAGGGGKGMRIVNKKEELEESITRAMSESQSAFGDPSVFIERYVASPRHIEVQIIADSHGNVVHLFERECSIQRRHQKVIEEAPSSIISPELRNKMGQCAVQVAKLCNYINAGTVEFLLDENLNFYFLEMNTRLQVEHPVTEMITGLDLVKEQIRIAEGKKLSFSQNDLSINGHSIEVRVYAEDPQNNFLPDTGKLHTYLRPQGNGVRVDDGFEQGMTIPVYYDPLISKLIVHGKNRKEAISKMLRAIEDYVISGVKTTLPFCSFVLKHEAFTGGSFDTHFVQDYFKPDMLIASGGENMAALFATIQFELHKKPDNGVERNGVSEEITPWRRNRV